MVLILGRLFFSYYFNLHYFYFIPLIQFMPYLFSSGKFYIMLNESCFVKLRAIFTVICMLLFNKEVSDQTTFIFYFINYFIYYFKYCLLISNFI